MTSNNVRNSLIVLLIATLCLASPAWAQTLVDEGQFDSAEAGEPAAVEGAGTIDPDFPLFAGNDVPATLDSVQIDVVTDANITAFSGVDAWGAAYDPESGTLYHTDGDQLYAWSGGAPVLLGTIMDVSGSSPAIHGLAWYNGTMYGSNIGTDLIYTIDPGTQTATVHITVTEPNASISGLAADPTTGDLYGTDDGDNDGLVRINPDGSLTLVAAYLGGETDVDGLAISPDRMAYLITDDPTPPEFNVYNLNTDTYSDTVAYPWGESSAVQVSGAWVGEGVPQPDPQARFAVDKDFNDDNPAEVEVTISCNTGLPLEQTTMISEGDGVVFVVNDFADGEMDCEIAEVVPDGYVVEYFTDAGPSLIDCGFTAVAHGGFYDCDIENRLLDVDVEVTKVWIDENPQFNAPNVASAEVSCTNVAPVCAPFTCNDSGFVDFDGNPDTDVFSVFPRWDGTTTCSVVEVDLFESGIEVDDSECQGLSVEPGVDAECTIYNTRLYEGIPTLSQYGLGLLALLMLGMGFVAVRRFV